MRDAVILRLHETFNKDLPIEEFITNLYTVVEELSHQKKLSKKQVAIFSGRARGEAFISLARKLKCTTAFVTQLQNNTYSVIARFLYEKFKRHEPQYEGIPEVEIPL